MAFAQTFQSRRGSLASSNIRVYRIGGSTSVSPDLLPENSSGGGKSGSSAIL